ncbi:hypothetical protein HYV89_00490 [Candidatus Woesearchaeota archaeon]|nr:hypothetical protein [Candidatus Woesearchaeota archaeon]
MRISVNTETEEIEELRHAVAIIEDAIKRRENPDLYEEESAAEQEKKPELKEPVHQPQIQQQVAVEAPKVEEAKPQLNTTPELNITRPISYSQVQQMHQVQKPAVMPSKREERGSTPDIDISSLSMSNYGESKEGRNMSSMAQPSSSNSSFSSSPSSARIEPRGFEPRTNNKSAVKDIISSLRTQRPGQPIQMSDIVGKARVKNISESEARNWVSELQREGAI